MPPHDQRGEPFTRVFGGRIDMGAVESIPAGFLPGDYSLDGVVDATDYVCGETRRGRLSRLGAARMGTEMEELINPTTWFGSGIFGRPATLLMTKLWGSRGHGVANKELARRQLRWKLEFKRGGFTPTVSEAIAKGRPKRLVGNLIARLVRRGESSTGNGDEQRVDLLRRERVLEAWLAAFGRERQQTIVGGESLDPAAVESIDGAGPRGVGRVEAGVRGLG